MMFYQMLLKLIIYGIRSEWEVLGIIKGLTDTFSMSEWNVVWIDDDGESHGKRFYWKTEAREFYDSLPYYQKRLERVSW